MNKKILIIVHNDFEDTELVATRDVLLRKGIDVDLISMSGNINLVSAYKLEIKANDIIENVLLNINKYDALFIPGGSGVKNIDQSKNIDDVIEHFVLNKKIIGAICAAPILLAKRGILKDKRAICFPDDLLRDILRNNGTNIIDENVVVDGNIITGKDMKSSIEFGRQLSLLILNKK